MTQPDTLIPVEPIQVDYEDTLRAMLALRPQIEALTERAHADQINRVYLVGAGGSLAVMYPVQFLFDRHATAFSAEVMTSAEFVSRNPAAVGSRSLVVVGSHTGTTPETVEAAKLARSRGARVVALTRSAESPLAQAADTAFTYGSDHTVSEAKLLILYQLALSLLQRYGEWEEYADTLTAIDALPSTLRSVKEQAEAHCAEIAARFKDEPLIYTLSAGPNYGVGYALAMCYLQEMQWIDASPIHAAEFFHGAFEIVDENTPLILFMGEDESRPEAERALRFAQRYSHKVEVIDSVEFKLPGVADRYRGLVSPLALAATISRIAANFAARTGHALETRRYMFTVEY